MFFARASVGQFRPGGIEMTQEKRTTSYIFSYGLIALSVIEQNADSGADLAPGCVSGLLAGQIAKI